MDILELLKLELKRDPQFLEFSSSVPVSTKPIRTMKVGSKIKTLRNLKAGDFVLRKGSVGKIIGVSKSPFAYVTAFDSGILYVDPSLVVKSKSSKSSTTVKFRAPVSKDFSRGDRLYVTSSWGYMMNTLGHGSKVTVVSNSAGEFGPFEEMLVVRSSHTSPVLMIPSSHFDKLSEDEIKKSSSVDFQEGLFNIGEIIGDGDTATIEFDVDGGSDYELEAPREKIQESSNPEIVSKVGLIHRLQEVVSPKQFTSWLKQHKSSLDPEVFDFGMELVSMWGNKIGVVFSYPVDTKQKCLSDISTPYIFKSALCNDCVNCSKNFCKKHSASLLSEKEINTTSDTQFLKMLSSKSNSPMGFHRVFSSLEDYVEKELFPKVKITSKSSLELEFEPDI